MRLWLFITVLTIATAIGVIIHQDPGYAFFSYGNWTIEMPLWIMVFLFVLTVTISLFVLWILNAFFSGTRTVKYLWKRRQEHNARIQTYRGLLELAEGHWQKAERYLTQSAPYSETPLLNYLSAAQAAEEGGSIERRDRYLQLALDASAGSDVAVRLTQAQLQLKHGELDASVRNLQRLHQEAPKHPKVLRLLCTLYEAMNQWQALFALLPAIKKSQALPKELIERLELKAYPALLPLTAEKGTRALMRFWQECPIIIQSTPSFVLTYAKILIKQGAPDEAESVIRGYLKKSWDSELAHLYGLVQGKAPKKQLSFAETLLPEHLSDPWLRLTLGRLYIRNQLWGKAREHLEQGLTIKALPETYAELGALMEQLGLPEKRDEYYKKGLLLATQTVNLLAVAPPSPSTLCLSVEDSL